LASIHRLPRHVQFRLRGQRAVESFIGCEHNFFRCRQRVRVGRLLAQLLRQHQIVRVPKVKDELRPIEAGSRVFQNIDLMLILVEHHGAHGSRHKVVRVVQLHQHIRVLAGVN
jgi:hypothetical protein